MYHTKINTLQTFLDGTYPGPHVGCLRRVSDPALMFQCSSVIAVLNLALHSCDYSLSHVIANNVANTYILEQ